MYSFGRPGDMRFSMVPRVPAEDLADAILCPQSRDGAPVLLAAHGPQVVVPVHVGLGRFVVLRLELARAGADANSRFVYGAWRISERPITRWHGHVPLLRPPMGAE